MIVDYQSQEDFTILPTIPAETFQSFIFHLYRQRIRAIAELWSEPCYSVRLNGLGETERTGPQAIWKPSRDSGSAGPELVMASRTAHAHNHEHKHTSPWAHTHARVHTSVRTHTHTIQNS